MRKTDIVNRIRELRLLCGQITQADLADAVGVSRQTIVAIEKAKYSPSLDLAFKIAAVFGEPVEDVFWVEK